MLPRHYEPTGAPSHALWANGTLQPAYRRRSREVGQVGRAGLVGIVWRLLRPFRYLIGSREPARGRARPMASGRTCVTSRLTRALAILGQNGLVQAWVLGGSESTVNVTQLRVRVLMYLSHARATELSRLDGIHTPRPLVPSVYE